MAGLLDLQPTTQAQQVNNSVLPTIDTTAAANSTTALPTSVAQVSNNAPVSTARDITNKETVAGQLNDLLQQDSPVMQSAKAHADAASAQRGLLNSSIAVGSAQRAVIDAATPIATSDAQTYANSGLSAQQANQQTSLAGYQARLNSAQGAENFANTTAANSQNIAGNLQIADKNNAAQMERLNAQIKSDETKNYASTLGPIAQQYQVALSDIMKIPDSQLGETADAATAQRNRMINTAYANYQQQVNTVASIFNVKVAWDSPTAPSTTATPTTTGTGLISSGATFGGPATTAAQVAAQNPTTDAGNQQGVELPTRNITREDFAKLNNVPVDSVVAWEGKWHITGPA